jgi:hypothetical protein
MKRKQFPPGPLKLPTDPPPKKHMIRFFLFMLWQSILHGRGRR